MIWSSFLYEDNLLSILLNAKEKLNKKGKKLYKNNNIKRYCNNKYYKLNKLI